MDTQFTIFIIIVAVLFIIAVFLAAFSHCECPKCGNSDFMVLKKGRK